MEQTNQTLLQKIYDNKGFLDKYGGSTFVTLITVLIFIGAILYFHVMSQVKPIKKNWIKERCSPTVIPFAGLINKSPHKGVLESTSENFSQCINNILLGVAKRSFNPIEYATASVGAVINSLMENINNIRRKIADMLNQITGIIGEIMGKAFAFLIPLQRMLSKMMTIAKKAQATMVVSMYNVVAGYLGIRAFMGTFVDLLIIFLVTLTAIITPLLFFFFTIPLAIPGLIVYGIVAAFTLVIITGMSDILHMTKAAVPPKPRCFDGETIIYDSNRNPIAIKDLKIGSKLHDGSIVNATFVLSSHQMEMYRYKGSIVSGNHYVLDSDGWTTVAEMEDAEKIEDYREPFIYCINTTTKLISINGAIYSDWDSLDDMDIIDLRVSCKAYLPQHFTYDAIHKNLVGGFHGDTMVELDTGECVPIRNVEVNDVLRFGERILGKVEIDATTTCVKQYTIGGHTFIGGPNNIVYDNDIGIKSTLNMDNKIIANPPEKLYHLITDSNYIILNGTQFVDYDGNLEKFLEGPQITYMFQ